MPHIYYTT